MSKRGGGREKKDEEEGDGIITSSFFGSLHRMSSSICSSLVFDRLCFGRSLIFSSLKQQLIFEEK